MNIIRQATVKDILLIEQLATTIWYPAYQSIISTEQIEYMLKMMYSPQSLQEQMQQGHQFFILYVDNLPLGFASVSVMETAQYFKLNKLYVDTRQHQKGLGKALLNEVISYVKTNNGKHLQLQVNKQNAAVQFYQKMGFEKIDEMVLDIGNGYVMDDFIMELDLV